MAEEKAVEEKSELVAALEERLANRRTFEFDAANFIGPGGTPIGKIKIRVVTKGESDKAVLAARKYVEEAARTEGVDGKEALADRDLLVDAKTAHVLHAACRDAKDPKYPAFLGPKWMMDHVSTDEISVLLNHYNEVLRVSGPLETDFSDEKVEALADSLAKYSDTDGPNVYLIRYTRDQLGELLIRVALKLREARGDLDALVHEKAREAAIDAAVAP